MTPSMQLLTPRPPAWTVVPRWLLVSLVLTGVISMHVLSQHDAAGGHHGSIIDGNVAAAPEFSTHGDHGSAVVMAAPAARTGSTAAPVLMPTGPGNNGADMAACILFLVIGAGAVLLALLTAARRRFESVAARSASGRVAAAPRGPPLIGPPRISLCVLRV